MVKQLLCPNCYERGECVLLTYDKPRNFYKCPLCRWEIWPDDDAEDYRREQESREAYLEELNNAVRWSVGGRCTVVLSLVPQLNHKKRGSNKTGKRNASEKKHKKDYLFYMT